MNEIENIRNRVFSRDKSSLDPDVFWMCYIMQEFGYTLKEMEELSVPTFKILIQYLIEQDKKVNEKIKKSKRGKFR